MRIMLIHATVSLMLLGGCGLISDSVDRAGNCSEIPDWGRESPILSAHTDPAESTLLLSYRAVRKSKKVTRWYRLKLNGTEARVETAVKPRLKLEGLAPIPLKTLGHDESLPDTSAVVLRYHDKHRNRFRETLTWVRSVSGDRLIRFEIPTRHIRDRHKLLKGIVKPVTVTADVITSPAQAVILLHSLQKWN